MTEPAIHPVLLCGGSGTRLWPLSRKSYPKQFAPLTGDQSLFQQSALRLSGPGYAAPTVVTGSDFRFIVLEQLAGCGLTPARTLIEPAPRNTGPAILAAALDLRARVGDVLMLVAPSDHVIPDAESFRAAVAAAVPAARAGALVTFGIAPDRAETGYGWLELDSPLPPDAPAAPQPLLRFVEKPDAATAQTMLAEGRYLWNAGIFLFSTATIVDAFAAHAPQLMAGAQAAVEGAEADLGFTRLAPEPWAGLEDISVDYAVMERAPGLSVVPFRGKWSDLGGWEAVWRESGPDAEGMVTHGDAVAIDCQDSLLRAEADSQRLVGIGLRDIVAIAMPDAVLVAHKDHAQEVKQAVAALKAAGAPQAEAFPRDHRPWGWFESLALGPRFQVKRIVVHPGAALSLQSHHHRAEHWVVVEGTARVTIGEKVQLVPENESVFIPLGERHRLENPGKLPLTLIEVQTGAYLGEDDIVRHEDVYARGQGAKG
ncbi:mannose-1-phosphate guanylyltransferase/mannose-6-phosphate isomerase [Rhodobacteraceae bacterium 2376]|uniref:mannose-1-phosphate guanylyltransferase n=1 Tax=Rhabdonatronobacter sediminivivens TaxID=2743469 RepID=A0A7Z0HYV4_9RHOB|nr:mannose-1-phosphate guanylyltransferase/mannose-6-phosphate isomerase [Rhabdonatronobacter sediminivivens]NYS24808.1 mannose-1-phosphate guanylyltransferase/mannose-6-phosphate isomerase [Rhabdonatronobacter sediminivivens]